MCRLSLKESRTVPHTGSAHFDLHIRYRSQYALIQKQVRAAKKHAKKQRQTGMTDMFGAVSLVDADAGHANSEGVDEFWCSYLERGPVTIDCAVFVRLIQSGKVVNLASDATRRQKRPLHFEVKGGEQLGLTET